MTDKEAAEVLMKSIQEVKDAPAGGTNGSHDLPEDYILDIKSSDIDGELFVFVEDCTYTDRTFRSRLNFHLMRRDLRPRTFVIARTET